jgi:hypothetical protein
MEVLKVERRFEVNKNSNWKACEITDLEDGDEFRIFDDNEELKDAFGSNAWIASGTAYKNIDGIMEIKTKEVNP